MKFRIEHYGTRLVLNVFRTANWFSEVKRTELNSPLSSVLFCRADVNQWTLALVSIRRRTHAANKWNTCVSVVKLPVITPRVSRRRREMYIGHARLCVCVCVCLSVCRRIPTLLHGPDVSWGNGTGCPLLVHNWADLQSIHGFRCYDNIAPNAKRQRVLVLALCLVYFPSKPPLN